MKQFLLAAAEYTHLEFHNTFISLRLVLWGLYVGILGAIAISFFRKVYLGALVRKLISAEALSESSALTLAEAGFKESVFFRHALKDGGALRRYVSTCGEGISVCQISKGKQRLRSFFGQDEPPKSYDFSKIKLYIPEELKYRADVVYEKQGFTPVTFVVFAAVLTAVTVGVSVAIPELLTMLDNFLVIILGS